ncbi:class I SAM-dependent methyltransferase [Caldivirga maquilingensis]|uniref:Putative RNA methylase n=1 Tax=Caldivirga maquilingensis (strain ATCC 700844 / DSM 13496 / JCM 10307 / IC-167) TaxID=397948 RepID=A8MAF1_CALMQ|nr:class I SAM-dependent methyltransferase [Caldivirga maquilingensis]ABW02528.1 putative RNA methylase [Caldivirga maquilingensis IC-167]
MSIKVPYVPTPTSVAMEIIKRTKPRPGEVIVDAGAGECNIVIEAARRFELIGLGIEKDPVLVKRCLERINAEGLRGRVYVAWGDIFQFNYSIADIVYLYLGTDVNKELAPILFSTLKRGARVVSHDFEIPGYKPTEVGSVKGPLRGHKYYLYIKT